MTRDGDIPSPNSSGDQPQPPLPSQTLASDPTATSAPEASVLITSDDFSSPAQHAVPGEWKVGEVILGLYQVKQVHTGGAMGVVYRVLHRVWNVDMAVKSPRANYFVTERHRRNFVRECETWVNLPLHPNVVAAYYVRVLGGIPRIFAEYVEGRSLAEWIRSRLLYEGGPERATARMLDIAIGFARGLHHAHAQGLIHQDVKPANVMMTPDGVPKVTDFGMAKALARSAKAPVDLPDPENRPAPLDPSTHFVSAGGMTPAYCSPEQSARKALSIKTDIWSFGLSVLEMWAGSPFWVSTPGLERGPSAPLALARLLDKPTGDQHIPAMPPGLIELLRQCFHRNPDDRPADMLQVAQGLEEVYRQATGQPYPRKQPTGTEELTDHLNNRAVSLLDLGKHAQAQQLWQQVLGVDPHHVEASYHLGLSQWRAAGRTDEALVQTMRQLVNLNPGQWLPPYLLAMIHVERGDFESAVHILSELAATNPGNDRLPQALATARDLRGNSRRILRTFPHKSVVHCACLTGDGKHLLTGDDAGLLHLWDTTSGALLHTTQAHYQALKRMSLVPAVGDEPATQLMTASADGSLKVWDLSNGQCLRELLYHNGPIHTLSLARTVPLALTQSIAPGDRTGVIIVWDTVNADPLHEFHGRELAFTALALAPHGRVAMGASADGRLKLLDPATMKPLAVLDAKSPRIRHVAFSPDGQIAATGGEDKLIRIWDLAAYKTLRVLQGHAGIIRSLAFTSDGRHLLSCADDRTARLWNLPGGRCIHTFDAQAAATCIALGGGSTMAALCGQQTDVRLLAIHPNLVAPPAPAMLCRALGSEGVISAQLMFEGVVQRAREALDRGQPALAAQFLRGARSLPGRKRNPTLLAAWQTLYLCLPKKPPCGGSLERVLEGHAAPVHSVALSRDEQSALSASADGTVRLWELSTGQCLSTIGVGSSPVHCVTWMTDGTTAIVGTADKRVGIYDPRSGKSLRTMYGHAAAVHSVAASPDGRFVLSGSADKTLRLWETASGRCLQCFYWHAMPINVVGFTPDGQYALSASSDGTMCLWELSSGRAVRTFLGAAGGTNCAAVSPEGRFILAAIAGGFLGQWDIATGQCAQLLEAHAGAITAVCVSADARYGMSGGTNKLVKLWQLATGRTVATLEHHGAAVTAVAFAPSGRLALSASADKSIALWSLDWELEERQASGWDEAARPYLNAFLSLRTPPCGELRPDAAPSAQDITRALTRSGRPVWTRAQLNDLLHTLACAGFGSMSEETVRRQLEAAVQSGHKPPALPPLPK